MIGLLAALRHRDERGIGQHVDISMFDATAAMTDIVMNLGSLGVEHLHDNKALVLDTFQATDGFFVLATRARAPARTPGADDRPSGVAHRSPPGDP